MPRFRRRSEVVTAEQFHASAETWPDSVTKGSHGWFYVATKSGPFKIHDGDWIVTYDDGTRIVVMPAIFPVIFEAV